MVQGRKGPISESPFQAKSRARPWAHSTFVTCVSPALHITVQIPSPMEVALGFWKPIQRDSG